jgi:UDP-glucose 4-epimerase
MKKKTKVLVTGGAGFIGSHLVARLVSKGMQVVVLDNLSSGFIENVKDSLDKIQFVNGDVRDQNLVRKLVRDSEVVFHLAANASVPVSVSNPEYDFQTNVIGTFNLLHSSIGQNLKSFVFASSAAIYGSSNVALSERCVPDPVSPYGAAKLCGETLGLSYKRCFKIPFVVARIFNVYGTRMPRYVMHDFYWKLRENPKELKVLGNGKQLRQFCYVDDALDALMLIADKGMDVYNIAGGEVISMEELAKIFVEKMSPEARITTTGKSWPGDIAKLLADISKLRKLGFRPKTNLAQGISSLIKWFEERSGSPTESLGKEHDSTSKGAHE